LVGCLSGFRVETGSVAYWSFATLFIRLGEAASPWGGECGTCSNFVSNTMGFPLQLRKITENLSRVPKGTRLISTESDCSVVLTSAGEGLEWSSVPWRPWISQQGTGSTLGQRKYLPSCRTRGFPTSANFVSKFSFRALMWSANSGTPRSSCICLLLSTKGHQ
jgi:hypothetical protein